MTGRFLSKSVAATLFSVFAVALVSCRKDEPEPVVLPDWSKVIVVSGGEGWGQTAYVFGEETCSFAKVYDNLDDVLSFDANLGGEAVIVAYDNPAAVTVAGSGSGLSNDSYCILFKYDGGEAPTVACGSFPVEHCEEMQLKDLVALNAAVSIKCMNVPDGWEQRSTVTVHGAADGYWPALDSLSCSWEGPMLKAEGEYLILPQVSGSKPEVTLDVRTDDIERSFTLRLPHTINRGDILNILLDFENADYFNQAKASCSFSGEEASTEKWLELKSKTDFEDENRYYNVWIQDEDGAWKSIEVRSVLCSDASDHAHIWNDWDNAKKRRDTMAVAIFEHPFDGPVKVRVEKRTGTFSKVEVRPSTYGVETASIDDRTIEFTLPSYDCRKVSVEFNKDRYHNLFLIGTRPDREKPDPKDPQVLYYPAGEWEVGELVLDRGQTLYVDYGAVLYGNVVVKYSNCTIAGHGIISGEHLRHWGELYSNGAILVDVNWDKAHGFQNFKIRDVTFIDSPSWNLRIFNAKDIDIDGINMVSWSLNGDGIDICSCHEVDIRNCFLRNYDDCITLKCRFTASPQSDTYNVEVHDCLIWNDFARGIVVGPEAGNRDYGSGCLRDILIHDCIILENVNSTNNFGGGFAIGQYASPDYSWGGGTANDIKNITARDIIFDSIQDTGRNVLIQQDSEMAGTCRMTNILLENFTVYDKNGCRNPICMIQPAQHSIEGLVVRNFVYKGNKITDTDRSRFVIKGTDPKVDITFE